jgi:hypothetical protein
MIFSLKKIKKTERKKTKKKSKKERKKVLKKEKHQGPALVFLST